MWENSIQVLQIERHDVCRVSAVEMNGGRSWTMLEEIREGRVRFPRTDIILINFWREGESVAGQRTVHPYDDGIPRGDGWDFLTPAEQKWCHEENERIQITVKAHPECSVLLRSAARQARA